MDTLNYVLNQSEFTVQTLRNVTEYLSVAKNVSVAQIFLPSDVKDDIDRLNADLISAANTLELKTNENSNQIRRVFNTVYDFVIPRSILETIYIYIFLNIHLVWLMTNSPHYRRSALITLAAVMLLISILGLGMYWCKKYCRINCFLAPRFCLIILHCFIAVLSILGHQNAIQM